LVIAILKDGWFYPSITMSDIIREKWSVWTAFVRFEDNVGGKERPVIVFDDRVILCICMGVTSKEKDPIFGYKIRNWKYAGLVKESWVRFEYLKLEPDDFRDMIGMLHPDDIEGIKTWMKKLVYGHDL